MASLKTVAIILFLVVLISIVGSSPPELPVLIYGKVLSEKGKHLGGVEVQITWTKEDGNQITQSTRTRASKELLGEYSLQNIDAAEGSLIRIKAGGKEVVVNAVPGVLLEAPDITISEDKPGFLQNTFNFIASLFGFGEEDSGYLEEEDVAEVKESEVEQPDDSELNLTTKSYEDIVEELGAGRYENDPLNQFSPIINSLPNQIYICEGQKLFYKFSISEKEAGNLTIGITPENIFDITPKFTQGKSLVDVELYSERLTRDMAGDYERLFYVYDDSYIDTRDIIFTVIETNNAPYFEDIRVQTVLLDNKKFEYELKVTDEEDEIFKLDNLVFSLDSNQDKVPFTIEDNRLSLELNKDLIGVHDISICVMDRAISKPHLNISLCNQDGSSNVLCQNFSLTVTESNRAPEIVLEHLDTKDFSNTHQELIFSITKNDLDGTTPDTYWYLDGKPTEYDSGSLSDEFKYYAMCGPAKSHYVKAEITDGLLNDSYEWDIKTEECSELKSRKTLISLKGLGAVFKKRYFEMAFIIIALTLAVLLFLRARNLIVLTKEIKKHRASAPRE